MVQMITNGTGRVRSFEMLDGMFAALLSGPDLVLPSEFVPEIMGQTPFDSMKAAQGFLELLMRHWNAVEHALARHDRFVPALTSGGDRTTRGRDWALGYQAGIRFRSSSWDVIRDHRFHADHLKSILALTGELTQPPRMEMRMEHRSPDGTPFIRDLQFDLLGNNVSRIYRLLEPARQAATLARPTGRGKPQPAPRGAGPGTEGPADWWEVGLIPVPGTVDSDTRARPVAVIIADAAGMVLHLGIEHHPPAADALLAEAVAREVLQAEKEHGRAPLLRVRDAGLAAWLGRLPELRRMPVEVRDELPAIEEASRSLIEELGGAPGSESLAHSATWAGWGLPDATIAAAFGAAAQYYRAAPWKQFTDHPAFHLHWPDGVHWGAAVMGAAGEEMGLALFADPGDADTVVDLGEDAAGLIGTIGMMVSVVFASQREMTKPTRKEVLARGWEMAGPDAYPLLMVVNSPTAGISESTAERVIQALDCLARLGSEGAGTAGSRPRKRKKAIQWSDPVFGISVRRAAG